MSKYSYKNKYSDDETEDDTIYKSYRDKFPSKVSNLLKKSSKSDLDDTDFDNDNNDRVIRIKEFDMNSIPPHDVKDNSGVKIVVIGKPGSGKSTILQDIMAYKAHITPVIQIFSGTEDSNHFFSEKCPPVCVYNKFDEKAIEGFVKRQKIAKKYLENPWAMQIIDDCTDDPKSLAKPLIQAYYKNGRHWKMIHVLSLQYCLDIKPSIRSNIDYTFILRETNLKNRLRLHENYAGCIDNFQDFCDIMDQITEDYTALVINNRVQSNKVEDCVFYYKANPKKIPPNWKFGHPSAWDFNNERFDPLYTDPVLI